MAEASRCSWRCQSQGRQGAGLSCWASAGTRGSHREPGQGTPCCGQPLPLPAPPGAGLSPPCLKPGVLDVSCPGWRMPQVTGGTFRQLQRGLSKWLLVGPEPVPASCPQPCRLTSSESWGGHGGPFGGRGCAARPPSAAPAPPTAARCPFNREP